METGNIYSAIKSWGVETANEANTSTHARGATYAEQVGCGFPAHHFLPHVDSPVFEEELAVREKEHGILSVLSQRCEEMESRDLVGTLVLLGQPRRRLLLSQQLLIRASGAPEL